MAALADPGFWARVAEDLLSPDRVARIAGNLATAALIALAAHVAIRLGTRAVDRFFLVPGSRAALLDPGKAVTLRGLLKSLLRYGVDFGAAVAILSQFVSLQAVFAGVGIAGIAVGLGAQSLVRDVIAGLFILLEDQFNVGDHVAIDGIEGIVEEIGLRVTRIRDFGGQLHILPNGRIERVTNFSRGPMRVMFTVAISYEEDIDRALAVMQQACDEAAAEDDRIVEGPRVLGVTRLGESAVDVLIWARAQPGTQWDVERQLRLRIKRALDAAGIQVPHPRRVAITAPAGPGPGPGPSPAAEPAPARPAAGGDPGGAPRPGQVAGRGPGQSEASR